MSCKKIKAAARRFGFTEREQQTIAFLAQGNPWKFIGEELKISLSTVRFHVRNILKKTNSPSMLTAFSKIFLE